MKNVLTGCPTVCYGNCTVLDHNTIEWILRTAEKIIKVSLPSIDTSYRKHFICVATTHPTSLTGSLLFCHLAEGTEASMPPPPNSTAASSLRQSVYCCLPTPTCANQNPTIPNPPFYHRFLLLI